MVPALALAFIVVPLAELAVIIAVGRVAGFVDTLLLLLAFSVLGAWVARREGWAAWRRFQYALAEGRMPAVEVADGAMVLLAGALLLTPGFLTDLCGLLLLLPPVRAGLRRRVPALLAWRRRRRARAGGRTRVVIGESRPTGTRAEWGDPEIEDRPGPPQP